jgi:hypothetical protein
MAPAAGASGFERYWIQTARALYTSSVGSQNSARIMEKPGVMPLDQYRETPMEQSNFPPRDGWQCGIELRSGPPPFVKVTGNL